MVTEFEGVADFVAGETVKLDGISLNLSLDGINGIGYELGDERGQRRCDCRSNNFAFGVGLIIEGSFTHIYL